MNLIRRTGVALFTTALLAVGSPALGTTAAWADAGSSPGTQSITETFQQNYSIPILNPCTGNPVTVNFSANSLVHITFFTAPGADEFWFTATNAYSFNFTDPSGVSYAGNGADWSGVNLNQSSAEVLGTINAQGSGTDGSHISVHGLFVLSISSLGPPPVVEVSINSLTFSCR